MKTFLEYVAEDILAKHGTNLSQVAIVFPNKRASLFMNSHFAQHADKPMWTPAYITISDLFRQHTSRQVADPIKQVCDLYQSFIQQTGFDETLDHFYSWGQLLLADFDDLDKNMADADKVFANLRDYHELDDASYLTPNQKAILAKFFSNFSNDTNTQLKERFLRLWSHMADIYHDFNQRLADQGLAYEGALYREVVRSVCSFSVGCDSGATSSPSSFPYDHYIFVGFNLLQQVEQQLFAYLKREGKAHFYWDFDHYYMKDNEAGHYIGQYLSDFPNELDITRDDIYRNFSRQKDITFMSAPTENIQARYVSTWLHDQQRQNDGRRTAIVLCNENLLQTVVHCIPNEIDKLNITTGFPLAQSPVASLIQMLINLQTLGYDAKRKRFRQRPLRNVLRHPYMANVPQELIHPLSQPDNNALLIEWMCDILTTIAHNTNDNAPLFQEAVYRAYTLLNRLLTLVQSGDLTVSVATLQRLVSQLVQSTSIPFHGEPAEGIQIMGVLETRNLDFDHVLLLSCNEGNLPRGVNDTSFIPYNLRKAYGLTTIDHKVAIFSYYFHRLLQRASDVTILYNNATNDSGGKGEMSRFMLQLMVEDQTHTIHYQTLQAGQQFTPFRPASVEKTPQIMQKLLGTFHPRALLTPTAINRYMRCPLLFYYVYACGLREPDIPGDETIDSRLFGDIFHHASQIIYTRLMQKSRQILKSDLEQLLNTRVDIIRAVDEAISSLIFQGKPVTQLELNGLQLINREVIIHYLTRLLEIDLKLAPFTIEGLETDVQAAITTPHITTQVGGRIDRLDRIVKDGVERIRVIDYKTGSKKLRPLANVEAIFAQESLANHSDYYLQAILYASIVRAHHPQTPVAPALLFIQHSGGDDYDPTICFGSTPVNDVADYSQHFAELLRQKVDEIFDPQIAFVPTDDPNRCRYCAYKQLCSIR